MFEVKNNIFEMEIMMSVRIIIDSASDLTKEQADKLGLDFLPLKRYNRREKWQSRPQARFRHMISSNLMQM